ncbi:Transposase [Mesorhizobium muleiense]|uniref:Transposase n=1 Tax=Mesorhizobium muleiense TaxID=1004279 RepID=A0A1G9DPW0_9HYPH|nr:Transposase [Mesorhizobium muleiense]
MQIAQRWVLARLRNQRFFSLAGLDAAIRCSSPNSTPAGCAASAPAAPNSWPGDRQAEAGRTAGSAIRVCALEALPRRPTVTRRSRATGIPRPTASSASSAYRRQDRRDLPHGAADRQPTPERSTGAAIRPLPITCRARIAANSEWTPGTDRGRRKIGPATAAVFHAVIADRLHPEQGFRTCLGILALTKSYGNKRVDAACQAASLSRRAPSPRSARSSRTA